MGAVRVWQGGGGGGGGGGLWAQGVGWWGDTVTGLILYSYIPLMNILDGCD